MALAIVAAIEPEQGIERIPGKPLQGILWRHRSGPQTVAGVAGAPVSTKRLFREQAPVRFTPFLGVLLASNLRDDDHECQKGRARWKIAVANPRFHWECPLALLNFARLQR